ncbi:glutamine-synthetase adenylyltransferase [Yoonia sp. 208BN28-4]|uniref:[protein-PII] uridylyltransferase family protein n=1 Tax=Yoonia sp. 208BN28-4 TaxID=3126505 RepID=UPI003095849F
MSIAARQTRCPDPYDPERGADAIAALPDLDAALHPLIAGAAGCSPYLAGLIAREGAWLTYAVDDPEQAMDALIAGLPDIALKDLPDGLRQAKRRMALITALADLAGVWPLETVTGYLTDFANACVDTCIRKLVAAEVDRGKVPGMGADVLATACGMTALAMGKMGAGELNYSSDIDLICLYDETRFDPDDYFEARTAFVRVTRKMAAILSDVTGGGYVFRTDLRLRPDPATTPVCLSMEAAERYYESVGRTWERAAYIKAHPSGGDVVAAQRFLDTLRPFVWRKHLDFAAIQDAHDMRLKIRDHKGLHGPLTLEGHNMKLGRGGIREIEFFTQTRQLIAGGRDPDLRVRGTRDGLQALAKAGWVPPDHADTLYDHYRAHREVEHRLQMINDAQTHQLPTSDDGFARLAAFMGTSVAALRDDLTRRIEEVHGLTEGFFAPDAAPTVEADWAADITSRWPTYPALRSDRATEIFKRLRPEILRRLQDAAKPDEALREFDGFLRGLPAGVQLFSLFEANPALTQLLVDIAATAPALAQYLSRNAGVFDAVIGGAFFDPWPAQEDLNAQIAQVLAETHDYESSLIAARRWAKEWHFRIGVHYLRGLSDARESGAQYAALAQAVLTALWPVVTSEFARKHGAQPGRGAVVIGMGSLGAGQLNAASDLDLIVIYDAQGVDASDGKRPLATRPFYARLTQALVTALSAPMSEGRLYEVDMRLRPSGRSGPVATSLQSFTIYQQDEAWTWEHLALTRARVMAGAADVAADVAAFRTDLLSRKASGASIVKDVMDMRERIADGKANASAWDAKIGAGRLQDCELFAQTAALRAGSPARSTGQQLQAGVANGWLSAADVADISAAATLFWQLQAASKLLTGGTLDPDVLGEGGRRLILRETDCDDMSALAGKIETYAAAAHRVITAKLTDGS